MLDPVDLTMNMFLFTPSNDLDSFFVPRNIAIIGASEREGSVGRTLLWNLLRSPFGGTIFPVNPKRKSILGIKAYARVKDIPEEVSLAIIVTPAKTVPKIIAECVEAKVKAVIIISAGFKEMGPAGVALEKEILSHVEKGKIRIVGPNCLGIMNPMIGLNATFAADIALKGNIAFVSQSGALCTAVLDWSLKEKVGFSAFVSVGSMIDVNWGDFISYFGNDPNTQSILIYMESIGDARSFLSAAREVALRKPIILIKAGITAESAKAAASHTGALSGSNDVLNAALHRVGVLRVDTIEELFSMAEILGKQPRPKGPQLTIVTNAGGPGVIATDALIESGGKLTKISEENMQKLNTFLPSEWSHNNPIDILGDASPFRYEKTVEVMAQDSDTHGILVILTPQYMTDSKAISENLKKFSHLKDVPILASWMGGKTVQEGNQILTESQIPTFSYPDMACKAFSYMWKYSYNLQAIYETPTVEVEIEEEQIGQRKNKIVTGLIDKVRGEGRTLLTEFEAKEILKAYSIPVVETWIADSEEKAIQKALSLGFPVVLKLHSTMITHKTDVGGVKLNLRTKEEVTMAYREIKKSFEEKTGKMFEGVTVQPMISSEGYEIILGSSVDPDFGPVLLFGMGGQLVEVFQDRALGLPPLTATLAKRLMEKTKIFKALQGTRGRKGVNIEDLQKVLIKFSYLIAEYPIIAECDINPLLAGPEHILALDARIVLVEEGKKIPRLAIRPYPQRYVHTCQLKDRTFVTIRPIRPEDESLIENFYHDVSKETLMQRFLQETTFDQIVAHHRLSKVCFTDYDLEIALLVEYKTSEGKKEILGAGRLAKISEGKEGVFAIVVKDKWHHKGIGTKILSHLIQIAKDEKIHKLIGQMLHENMAMQNLCQKMGFSLRPHKDIDFVMAELTLD
ncbi:MAG: bifunctional acetate--CoA ligase family protein/GNAT family N-acetyltransferase [Parachlamydiales bacterium]|nr:bifunctional acetate--CoA ligase family protein/GNAT family N-acetyltransferase [Parachlamydiales bacterium]